MATVLLVLGMLEHQLYTLIRGVFMRAVKQTIIIVLLLCVSLLTGCERNDHIRVYNEFLRTVSGEHRKYAEELYNQFSDDIEEIWIAEDSRSYKCIRFSFISEKELEEEKVITILEGIKSSLQSEAIRINSIRRPAYSIEVFFVGEQEVNKVFCSCYDKKAILDQEAVTGEWATHIIFSKWIEITYAEQRISVEDIVEMMKTTGLPMFEPTTTIERYNRFIEQKGILPLLPPYHK